MTDQLRTPAVLVITDNPSVRFWVKKQLDEQFFILDATETDEARIVTLDFPLDLIIVDEAFEEIRPFELCHIIRGTSLNSSTPILLITARLNKAHRKKALAAGITDFLSDQLDSNELRQRVEESKRANRTRTKTSGVFTLKQPMKDKSSTSLKGHTVSHKQAEQIFSEEQKSERPSSLLVLKIDQFLNLDLAEKEEIIPLLSTFLLRCTSQKDLMIPLEGGRFTLLLPTTQIRRAKKIARILQKELKKHLFKTKKGDLHISTSVAISKVNGSDKSLSELIEMANEAFDQSHATDATITLDEKDL